MGYLSLSRYLSLFYIIIIVIMNFYGISECQSPLSFSEKPAFLFLMNLTLCKLDINQITNNSTDIQPTCLYDGPGMFLAIDVWKNNTYMLKYLKASDKLAIVEQNIHPESDVVEVKDNVRAMSGMYFDWMGKNIIWSDHSSKCIRLYNLPTRSYQALITLSHTPRGAALDTITGRVFWGDDDGPSISWTVIGSSKTNYLIVEDIKSPYALTIDTTGRRLFWSDMKLCTISSVDIAWSFARDRRTLVTAMRGDIIYGIAISEDYLFWTSMSGAHVVKKDDGQFIKDFSPGTLTFDVVFNGYYSQPIIQNGCQVNNGGCSHICAPGPSQKPVCLCKLGYHLDMDEKSCITKTLSEDFILFTDSYHRSFYQIDLKTNDTYAIDIPINLELPTAVAYDTEHNRVFFIDEYTDRLYKFWIGNPNSVAIVHQFPDTSSIYGIAYDGKMKQLFLVSSDSVIYRIDPNGVYLETFLRNIGISWGIALDSVGRKIYWTDWTIGSPKIMRADMDDGSNIETIISVDIKTPVGIIVDTIGSRIYWVDNGKLSKIESSDLYGRHRTTLVSGIKGLLFGIAHDQHYIFVGGKDLGLIYKIDKDSSTLLPNTYGMYDFPYGLVVVRSANEATQKRKVTSPGMNVNPFPTLHGETNDSDTRSMYAGVGVTVVILVSTVGIIVAVVAWCKRKHRRPILTHGGIVLEVQKPHTTNGVSSQNIVNMKKVGEMQEQPPTHSERLQATELSNEQQHANMHIGRFTGNVNPVYHLASPKKKKPLIAYCQPTPAYSPEPSETSTPSLAINPVMPIPNPQPPCLTCPRYDNNRASKLTDTSMYETCTDSDDTDTNVAIDCNGLRPSKGRPY